MREILFRAKRRDNGEWVEGYYSPANIPIMGCVGHFINEGGYRAVEIDPETVCQYTGLKDKNGKKIFEGDMFETFEDGIDKMVVEFHYGCFTLAVYGWKGATMEYGWDEYAGGYGVVECEPLSQAVDLEETEVIGNIFDNPELMEGGVSNES